MNGKTVPPNSKMNQEDISAGQMYESELSNERLVVVVDNTDNKSDKNLLPTSSLPNHEEAVIPGRLVRNGNGSKEIKYDAAEIAAYYENKPFQIFKRVVTVLKPALGFAFGLWWDRKLGKKVKTDQRRAVQLRDMLTKLGPAYIKIGQALSTRPDLVPPAYLEELTRLQDQLPAFDNEIAYQFIQEELGQTPQEIYSELSPDPIAAASLGQVYRGKLKSTGEEVAVKVQRPDLRERIAIDLYILRKLSAWVQSKLKRVRSDLVGILDELGERIFEEMDYIHEGENAERFFELYGYIEDIYIPKIYWEYTNRRVLTMEWIEGIKLTELDELKRRGVDPTHVIEVGVQCSLRQLLEHGFFHADPHPGNLFAMEDGRMAYIDFGMTDQDRKSVV